MRLYKGRDEREHLLLLLLPPPQDDDYHEHDDEHHHHYRQKRLDYTATWRPGYTEHGTKKMEWTKRGVRMEQKRRMESVEWMDEWIPAIVEYDWNR
jgi:hypothetical protein